MNADDVRRAVTSCFADVIVHSVTFLAEGWGSWAWEVNGDHVFRFPKRAEIHPGLAKEIRLLPRLGPLLPLPVPVLTHVWLGGTAHGGPFVGYPKIPGVPLTAQHLRSARGNVARQLGEFLTALHDAPGDMVAAAGLSAGGPESWRDEYRTLYESVRHRVIPLLGVEERRTLSAGWEAFLSDEANFAFTPALVHRDLCGEHILFDARQERITGIIDWEDASVGDPAFDFCGLLSEYGVGFARQVLLAYAGPADAGMLHRASFYGAIAPCHEVLYGLDWDLAEHAAHGLDTLRAAWAPAHGDAEPDRSE